MEQSEWIVVHHDACFVLPLRRFGGRCRWKMQGDKQLLLELVSQHGALEPVVFKMRRA